MRTRIQQYVGVRIYQFRRELATIAQDNASINVYFTKLKGLWEELMDFRPRCTCDKCDCTGAKEIE